MMRVLVFALASLLFGVGQPAGALAETYKLLSGETVEGSPVAPDAQGVVIKRPNGTFSERIGWTNFNETALREFAKLPQAKRFIEPLIEVEIEEEENKKAASEITVTTPARMQRPDPKAGFGALFSSGLSVFLLLLLYVANLYAAYEISIFKFRPVALVCGVAAVAPVIGPLVFLCLPRWAPPSEEEAVAEYAAEEAAYAIGAAAPEAAPGHAPAHAGRRTTTAVGGHAPAAAHPAPQIYQRGQFTFNRRFFETKLAGFLRVVPGEAERDLVIHVKSSRGEYVATRIARITPNDIAFQVAKGGASSEVSVPFNEVSEVRVQHKDA